jgi:carotenoid cleavage dioxygenase-like enzyme
MSFRFPDTPTFTGFNAPVRVEGEAHDLEVEGDLPEGLEGIFYRCGPDFRFPPLLGDDINHNGDGVVSAFRFERGRVHFAMRFVRTEKFEAEARAGRGLIGLYRNPYTDDPLLAGKDRTLANTNVVLHAGRLLAMKEDGLPYELDPQTLETRGRHDFAGRLKSQTFTAHPKIDPETGEMIGFGYEATGLASREMSLQVIGADGALVREETFEAPYVSFQHDFAVTERHILFALMPTTTSLERLKAGQTHWVFDPSLPTQVGIMPRDGSVNDLRWFSAPGRGLGHVLNAFSDGSKVFLDIFVSERCQFPFIPNADGRGFDRAASTPRLARWSFDLDANTDSFEEEILFPDFMEMPRTDDRFQTRPYRYGYCAVIDPMRPIAVAGTLGPGWNTIVRVDMARRRQDRWWVGENAACQEPQFVPRAPGAPEGDGWLLCMLTRLGPQGYSSELVILDAERIAAGPVATVRSPLRLRGAIHGNWAPSSI